MLEQVGSSPMPSLAPRQLPPLYFEPLLDPLPLPPSGPGQQCTGGARHCPRHHCQGSKGDCMKGGGGPRLRGKGARRGTDGDCERPVSSLSPISQFVACVTPPPPRPSGHPPPLHTLPSHPPLPSGHPAGCTAPPAGATRTGHAGGAVFPGGCKVGGRCWMEVEHMVLDGGGGA